jgi:DNA polymerase IIIc chi subunit
MYTNDIKEDASDPVLAKKLQREVILSAISEHMFCKFTKRVLDKKRTVVIVPRSTGRPLPIDAELWDEKHEDVVAAAPSGIEVYDGRELW